MCVSVIILAAGYDTRLDRDLHENEEHSHLQGIPKALLPINGKPLLSYWMKILQQQIEIDHVFIVTNAVYYKQFLKWSDQFQGDVSVINDLTNCNEERMGAVASIRFAVNSYQLQDKDILIIGGDTLFYPDFQLQLFLNRFRNLTKSATAPCCLVTIYTCKDNETEKCGILELDKDCGKVARFLEKPKSHETTSRLACPCFYLLFKCCTLIENFFNMKKDGPLRERDATGYFIKHLVQESSVYGYQISGRFDVGGLKSYYDCNNYFAEKEADTEVHSS